MLGDQRRQRGRAVAVDRAHGGRPGQSHETLLGVHLEPELNILAAMLDRRTGSDNVEPGAGLGNFHERAGQESQNVLSGSYTVSV